MFGQSIEQYAYAGGAEDVPVADIQLNAHEHRRSTADSQPTESGDSLQHPVCGFDPAADSIPS